MLGQYPRQPGYMGGSEAGLEGAAPGGSMRWAPATSLPLLSSEYYERVGRLQQGLRDSEKKRLDLEKKLYEYNQSDIYRAKLKYVKLKKYLKDICESEKKAHIRNQEYLKQFEHVEANVGHFTTSIEKLQELKIEYETQIKKMHLLSKDSLGIKGELKDEGREKVAVPAGINSKMSMSKGLYQPATIFMGHQMSAFSSIGDSRTEQESSQPTKNFSIPDPHSHRQTAPSSRVADSGVVQTPSDMQCLNKSDKVDGKTSLQTGEKTPVTALALSEEVQILGLEIGSSPQNSESNLSEGGKSAELHSLPQQRLSPENRTSDLQRDSCSRSEGLQGEILTREHIEVEKDSASPPISTVSVSEHYASENKWSPEKHSAGAAFSELHRSLEHMQEEQEEGSVCSSSDLTVSVSEDDLILYSPEPQPNPGTQTEEEGGIQALALIHTEQERDVLATGENDCVLQTLSSPDSKKTSSTNSLRQSEQAPDPGFLSIPSGQPAASLKEFGQSLHQEAAAGLKKALREECEASLAVHSDESCSSLSLLHDNAGIKREKPKFWLSSLHTRDQEVSSGCDDESKQESMSAKVPVTETKAYQLLKKSTLQEHTIQMGDRLRGAHASAAQFSANGLWKSPACWMCAGLAWPRPEDLGLCLLCHSSHLSPAATEEDPSSSPTLKLPAS
ncbi:centrosomal protein kizuna isoform X2 [Heterocephalus glaber]|uniref:Centrosomal protein kizuna n=1 Tax=Heterocephalus glaber TaxID=10181 RepID=A0AAX6SQK9_HETGA|nr:centrosomal protein kizuna isoform X2 [Heterocephalus glaber]